MRLYTRGRISGRERCAGQTGRMAEPGAADGTGGRTRAGAGSGTGFLRAALIAAAAAEVLALAGGVEGDDILSALARVEYAERAGVLEEGSGGFSGRLGIRFELKDGTLWFYRETIDTH